jgi:hypothetical protein
VKCFWLPVLGIASLSVALGSVLPDMGPNTVECCHVRCLGLGLLEVPQTKHHPTVQVQALRCMYLEDRLSSSSRCTHCSYRGQKPSEYDAKRRRKLSTHPRKAADDREAEGPTIAVTRLQGGGAFSKPIEHLAFASVCRVTHLRT